jgi:hypothetical protein
MLWQRKAKLVYFDTGLMAKHHSEAELLKNWYFKNVLNGSIANHFEVINLQRYKIIKNNKKVQSALREKALEPFVFLICTN